MVIGESGGEAVVEEGRLLDLTGKLLLERCPQAGGQSVLVRLDLRQESIKHLLKLF